MDDEEEKEVTFNLNVAGNKGSKNLANPPDPPAPEPKPRSSSSAGKPVRKPIARKNLVKVKQQNQAIRAQQIGPTGFAKIAFWCACTLECSPHFAHFDTFFEQAGRVSQECAKMEDLEDLNLQAIVEGQDYEKQLNRLVSIYYEYC